MHKPDTAAIPAGDTPASTSSRTATKAARIFAAAETLAENLAKSQTLDAAVLRAAMTTAFGADETTGAWQWRDAYDASEVAAHLLLRRYWQAMLRRDAREGAGTAHMYARLQLIYAALPSQTRRSDEQVALQQFSTPLPVAFLAARSALIRPGDLVLEPSAGNGGLAIFGELAGASLQLNEIAEERHGILTSLFPATPPTRHNAANLHGYLGDAPEADVVLMNPPFSADVNGPRSSAGIRTNRAVAFHHISAAWARLRCGGRLVAITGANLTTEEIAGHLNPVQTVLSARLPERSFQRQGTGVETRLHVFDRLPDVKRADGVTPVTLTSGDSEELIAAIDAIAPRAHVITSPAGTDAPASTPAPAPVSATAPKAPVPARQMQLAMPASPSEEPAELTYTALEVAPQPEANMAVFQPWQPGTFTIDGAQPHPSALAEAVAMASIRAPMPGYRPSLPRHLVEDGILSAPQLEAVIHAGEAHDALLPVAYKFMPEKGPEVTLRADEGDPDTFRMRRGWFLGDGTGAGKGRQVAAIILDNYHKGRRKALWLSKSKTLIEDARRDWKAVGGAPSDIIDLGKIKRDDVIPASGGILFATYATLRSSAGGTTKAVRTEDGSAPAIMKPGKRSRIDQITEWLGKDFDGVIIFDESHEMAGAGGGESIRGKRPPSQQGIAGIALQNLVPDARVVYVSATGASNVNALAYATRLGLWGQTLFPFADRPAFVAAMDKGGVAAAEVVARDLKATGLYLARNLSFDGIEIDILQHDLTPQQTDIYDSWADAFQIIHENLDAALRSTKGKYNADTHRNTRGKFESAKQRFFNHLLTAMKCPSLFRAIEADIEAGHAAIVQVVSTGESLMERSLAKASGADPDDLDLDISPRDTVIGFVENAFPTQLHATYYDEEGNYRSKPLEDQNGKPVHDPEAVRLRDKLLEDLMLQPPVPSALDQIIWHFGQDAVAEITGRQRRIVKDDDGRMSLQKRRPETANSTETTAFMEDRKRILVFSQAGGTGRSYHADADMPNNRQRVHYLLEAGWRADVAIQGLGRSNRTGQSLPPRFRPVTTNVKGEKRFIATIARRLDTLGAITKGQRNTASAFGSGDRMFREEDNFESRFAKSGLSHFYRHLRDGLIDCCPVDRFETVTGLKILDDGGALRDELPPMHTFLNRILALQIELQNSLFTHLELLIETEIQEAKLAGTYELGVESLIADSLTIEAEAPLPTIIDVIEKTAVLTVRKKTRVVPRIFERAIDIAETKSEYELVQNAQSKRLALKVPGTAFMDKFGNLQRMVTLIRPEDNANFWPRDYAETTWEPFGIGNGDEKIFAALWEVECNELPEFREETLYLVTGLLLPIWDKIPNDKPRVKRMITDDGQTILGRVLNHTAYRALLENVGVNAPKVTPDQIWTLLHNADDPVPLTRQMRLKRSLLAGKKRIEATGAAREYGYQLREMGLTVEIVQARARFFIPNVTVLERLLKEFPPQ